MNEKQIKWDVSFKACLIESLTSLENRLCLEPVSFKDPNFGILKL